MKKIEVKTKRLILHSMTDGEIEALMERIDNDELRTAYGKWYGDWHEPWRSFRCTV